MIGQFLYRHENWFRLVEFEQTNFFQKEEKKQAKKEKKNDPSAGRSENARLDRLSLISKL